MTNGTSAQAPARLADAIAAPDNFPSLGARLPRRIWLPLLLLLVASIPWRRGAYFSGGLDTVVIAKAALTVVAASLALPYGALPRRAVPAAPFVLLGLYLTISAFGAWMYGDLIPTLALVMRVGLAAVVVYCLLSSFDTADVLMGLARGMLVVGGFAAVTGLPTLSSGRLSGGLPPIAPNEIAILCGVPFIVLFWRAVYVGRSRLDVLLLVALAVTVYATASRTGIALLVAATLLALIRARHLRAIVVVMAAASAPLLAYVCAYTDVFAGFLDRGGTGNTATLNSRTIAWTAAAELAQDWLQHLFGAGMSRKIIAVTGQYWSTQTLDSTWVSTLVQAGYLGLVLLVGLIVYGARGVAFVPGPLSVLLAVLLFFSVGRSILESGMMDASSGFLTFFVLVTAAGAVRLQRNRLTTSRGDRL
ncbi:O-antigen ligase family protein [Rhodococcoides kroppenstedtii]|uniref:O-antigen ligase family protein n=1 Tax=Rhodococcoides kroppenstedtii TaxID=293050 RepID=UPI0028E3A2A4|nr:O-antigen ligase family protein [Rhodococcus kroppenstedtii]